MLDERAFVNGVVGLHATGGSTNHTIHLIAMAAAAGITLTWDDFADLADVMPLLTRIYPNGKADVNHFHAAGGMGLLIRELLGAGLLHDDVAHRLGRGLRRLCRRAGASTPMARMAWRDGAAASGDDDGAARRERPIPGDRRPAACWRGRSAAPSSRPRRSRRSAM